MRFWLCGWEFFNKMYSTGSKKLRLRNTIFGIEIAWKSLQLVQIPGETTKGRANLRMPQTKALSSCHLGDGGPTPSTHICIMTIALKQFPNKEGKWRKMCFQRWYSLKTKQEHKAGCRVSSSDNVKLPHSNSCLHLPLSFTFSSP